MYLLEEKYLAFNEKKEELENGTNDFVIENRKLKRLLEQEQ